VSAGFEEIWQAIQLRLKIGDTIPNWTALNGYLGDTMQIVDMDDDVVVFHAPNAKKNPRVYRAEFEKIWQIWKAYQSGRVRRQEITEISYFSKYIISVLHWLEN